jgi:APA family basic amino acid/polyamine antiporter
MLELFAVQTRYYCCRGCGFTNLRPLVCALSDKNILYEIGDFKLNAAQIVSIFYDYFTELHQQLG